MGIGDNVRRAAEDTHGDPAGLSERTDDGHVPDPDGRVEGQTDDVSARDSLAGDIANKIDPDMGIPEEGLEPGEAKSSE